MYIKREGYKQDLDLEFSPDESDFAFLYRKVSFKLDDKEHKKIYDELTQKLPDWFNKGLFGKVGFRVEITLDNEFVNNSKQEHARDKQISLRAMNNIVNGVIGGSGDVNEYISKLKQ